MYWQIFMVILWARLWFGEGGVASVMVFSVRMYAKKEARQPARG